MSVFRRKKKATLESPAGPAVQPSPPLTEMPHNGNHEIISEVGRMSSGLLSQVEARIERWLESIAARITTGTESTHQKIDALSEKLDGVSGSQGISLDEIRARIEENSRNIREVESLARQSDALGKASFGVADMPRGSASPVEMPPAEPEITFDQDNPDERFASVIRDFVGRAPTSGVTGNMVDVTVLGRLKNGEIAWVNESLSMFGTVAKNLLGEMEPQTDDRFRARVISYPWGHIVTAVVPYSLVSPFAARPVAKETVDSAGTPPDSVKGTQFERLRPGDVVLARIPYDGTFGLDKRGRTAKFRPSVFIRWGHDNYAWLRAIYDADGFVASNNLGIKLVDDSHTLDKASVVRNAEYDIDPKNIVRHLGRLGPRDLNALNIEDTSVNDTPGQTEQPTVNYDRADLDPVAREIPSLISAVKPSANDTPGRVMDGMLECFVSNDTLNRILREEGIHFAMVGHVFATLARSGHLTVPKGSFRKLIDDRLEKETPKTENAFEVRLDENNHPMLWLREGPAAPVIATEPVASPEVEGDEPAPDADPDAEPRFALDDEYETPDLIIYDQESASILMRDRRVDLTQALADLRADGDAPAYVIGSDAEYGWAAFQQAARHRGWKTAVTNSREEVCAAAARIAKETGATYVTVVGFHSDLIAELENNGHEVTFVSSLD